MCIIVEVENMNKVFIVMKEDVLQYPPILSMFHTLIDLNYRVVHIGVYSDLEQKTFLESKNVEFYNAVKLNVNANPLNKSVQQLKYKKYVKKVLEERYETGDYLLVVNEDTMCLLWNVIKQYKLLLYFLETPGFNVRLKYRMYNPSFNLTKACQKAYKVICCEYNRAHIIKGLYQLDTLPVILPNKYYQSKSLDNTEIIPEDVKQKVDDIQQKISDKKVILYQGVFTSKERRLEEFIHAVNEMSDDYVLLAMGRGDNMFEELKDKYSSRKILFVDFIRPPYHMLITQMAHIGVLSYFPNNSSFIDVLNPIYCAPNKIFEYAKYSLPMISNDLPALKNIFQEFHCGVVVDYPLTDKKIKDAFLTVFNDYNSYTLGAKKYYKSVDCMSIIRGIFN